MDVFAGDAGEDAIDADAGHQLGFLHGRAHGFGGAFDVGDDFAAHAAGARLAYAEDLDDQAALTSSAMTSAMTAQVFVEPISSPATRLARMSVCCR